ncbi:transcriptional regulator (plasmid) [Azospirillum sp. B510]|uniref:IclR family transcriptional regulator n=2 Tax=Alphaproteobacteria TaxID=28211 RepID=UPI0001C4CC15|nr:IclR family transcriptional regulator [Azospirillum sp. B510]BAI74875.1 transcriptional regulator [Azospirillum sp. B510]
MELQNEQHMEAVDGRNGDNDVAGGPRSTQRLLKILALLAATRDDLSLSELSQELVAPKSSLLNLLRPLVAQDFLVLHNNGYRLGPSAFLLAATIMERWSSTAHLRPYLDELARRSHETVTLAILDGDRKRVVFTLVIDSSQPLRYVVPPGSSAPLFCTAAGRVFLAFGDRGWRDSYLSDTPLRRRTPDTITSVPRLNAILDEVTVTKVASSIGETVPRTSALAAPVFGPDGEVAAALGLSAPAERMDEHFAFFSDLLRQIAARASGSIHVVTEGEL